MAPKKTSSSNTDTGSEKRKVVRKTVDFKKELIAMYEEGVRVSELAWEYGMAKSTISTILKNKDAIKVRVEKERTSEGQLPQVFMEGNSPSKQ